MKFKSLLFFACCLLIFSCNEADDDSLSNCFKNNPIEELPWLAEAVEKMRTSDFLSEYQYIVQARFGFETIFIFADCCPFCNSIWQVYDCNGEAIGYIGDGTFDFEVMRTAKLVYKPVNSQCTVN